MPVTLIMEKAKHKAKRIRRIQDEADELQERLQLIHEELRQTTQEAIWTCGDSANAWRDFESFVADQWERLDLRELGDVVAPIAAGSLQFCIDVQGWIDAGVADGMEFEDASNVQIHRHYVTKMRDMIADWPTRNSSVRDAARDAVANSREMTEEELATACCGAT